MNSGQFIMNDGETVVAVLNNDLTTKQAKQGDRFTMTVRDKGQYEGAVIEGSVATVNPGGTLTGRSGMTLDFDTIRLRSGQTYRFAGILTGVRALNGDTVKVDNEGSAQGDNQTTQTVTPAQALVPLSGRSSAQLPVAAKARQSVRRHFFCVRPSTL